MNKIIIISLDGNIGSGKSTLVNIIKRFRPEYCMLDEPVNEWNEIKDKDGVNLLENFYKDQQRWAYTFQNFAYITRLEKLKKAIQKGNKIIITERSIFTDKNIFAKMLYEDGKLSHLEWDTYNRWFDFHKIDINGFIYLRTSPQVCQQRIQHRNRKGEEGIPFDYLKKLHSKHEYIFSNSNGIKIDGNTNFIHDKAIQEEILSQIDSFILGIQFE